ncbi:unnamed protein product [Oppiella nova]|uniref:Carboxylic ester hydrolase n=1 Tax=Oppiella nova TaxID=334625 RepID=A0A7R9M288_9ACAR|nr:unnamed protein product [Oppiella nova]CAG2169356.1 unnamed protein product [Oppiella nova]
MSSNVHNETDVKTTSGVVRGQTIQVLNTNVYQFLGIPYAEPPVGALRFAKPQPIEKPLEGIIDATKFGNGCMQKESGFTGMSSPSNLSEDCLVLNIWTPNVRNKDQLSETPALKPVMFWIHGGGLSWGSSDMYGGGPLATYDVVFVSINYRLAHFGFLYGDREDAPGNQGFYDQLLALKWVRENIHAFGGDRDEITIFGESAGSWSVSAHILSPLSKGLFKRAIMQSGAQLFNKDRDMITKSEALKEGKELAKDLGCSDSEDWLQFLRNVDPKELVAKTKPSTRPVFGTEFLPLSAQKAFEITSLLNWASVSVKRCALAGVKPIPNTKGKSIMCAVRDISSSHLKISANALH